MLAIVNGKVILPDERENGHFSVIPGMAIMIEDGHIKDVVPEVRLRADIKHFDTWNAGGCYVSPGFINIHIHGCFGADTMDATEEAMLTMRRGLPATGVTSFLPTTMTCPMEEIGQALAQVRKCMEHPGAGRGAEVLGAYMEGPFISPAHKGSQAEANIRRADFGLVEPYKDVVKYLTLAPEELGGDYSFVDKCRQAGIIVSLGHSGAIYEEAEEAFRKGVSHATHLFNAMSPLHHREPGAVGAVLEQDFVAELIADDVHCHPAAQRLAWRLKGDKLVLITDSCRACGLGDGESELGGQRVFVECGVATLADGTIAASVAPMDRVVANFARNTGLSLPRTVELATIVPAREMGCEGQRGSLEPGKLANITVFDDKVNIFATFVRGQLCYGS